MGRKWQRRDGTTWTAVAACLVAGASCAAPPPASITPQQQGSIAAGSAVLRSVDARLIDEGGPVYAGPAAGDGARLINEGGPVYAIPGEVVVPTYFRGNLQALTVTAERLGGARVEGIPPTTVAADGSFTLLVPQGEEPFFASTVFPHDELLVRLRTLVQVSPDARVALDPLATLVAARISRTWQQGHDVDLRQLAAPTATLISNMRAALPASELNRVTLTGSNLDLARELSALAGLRPDLDYALNAWEDQLSAFPLRHGDPAAPPPK
ncbi:MAG: hypothetical protein VKQ33_00565 [Candidatus Sericytochromatia bacterium]|nr:hypothetical protein [Candidatus Sericytochromatia bacterium]